MNSQDQWFFRLGLLSELVEKAPSKLGRTAIMKLAYLLQTVKQVPLGYDFRLYTYGPFDSDVLYDMGMAEALGAVKSEMVTYPSGYGYEFTPGPERQKLRDRVAGKLETHREEIQWALTEFGQLSAADLELLTTIVYAGQEAVQKGEAVTADELCRRVKEVKPRFAEEYIGQKINQLLGNKLLSLRKSTS